MRRRSSSPSSHRSPPGQRQLRVGEQIRHLLADILREEKCHDPDLHGSNLITVTSVDISPDLKHAIAYVMPLGGRDLEKTLAALNRANGYFRREVGHRIDLRYTPKIFFRADDSFEQAEHIEKLLRQDRVRKDLERDDED